MKNALMLVLAISLLLAACASAAATPSGGDAPVNGDTPQAPGSPDYSPQAGDVKLTRGAVYLNSVDLLTMESFPLQFSLALKGDLPTPCNKLRVRIAQPDERRVIAAAVYSVVDPAMACAQVLEPFEVNIPLGSFPAGHYTVLVNGEKAAEFDA